MKRAILGTFAKGLANTDFSIMGDEGFSMTRLRIELLSGLTVALAFGARGGGLCLCGGGASFGWALCGVSCGSDHRRFSVGALV
jgi:hypothetical protein